MIERPEQFVVQVYMKRQLKEWILSKAKEKLLPPSTWVRSELESMRRGELEAPEAPKAER